MRSVHQNTIDYNSAPLFTPLLPDLKALKSQPGRALELGIYAWDFESADDELTFRITRVSGSYCGIGVTNYLGRYWIIAAPEAACDCPMVGEKRICEVDIEVSDSIEPASDTFQGEIVDVADQVFLPLILD